MGSVGPDKPDELTVLVTGFGPFKEQYPQNPSWEIAATLPKYLPAIAPKSRAHAHASAGSADAAPPLPPVRIHVYPQPVRVNWSVVRKLVPRLWAPNTGGKPNAREMDEASADSEGALWAAAGGGDDVAVADRRLPAHIDFALHIGMAGPRPEYHLEHRGHRDNYVLRDVDGMTLNDEELHREQGNRWIWHGLPAELETDFDVDDVLKRWKEHCPDDAALSISEDAGHYLCDFIYYSSMAHLTRAGLPRHVVFMHVPSTCTDTTVAKGRDVALQLIRSLAESLQTGHGRSQDGVADAAADLKPRTPSEPAQHIS